MGTTFSPSATDPAILRTNSTRPLERRPSTTDKTSLLAALAQELKSEKLKAEKAAKEMVHFEHLIEDKHTSFLSEQDKLSLNRDRNNSEIANLRRRLKVLKEELEEAQNVREEEAELYLNLLEGGRVGGRQIEQEGDESIPGVHRFDHSMEGSTGPTVHSLTHQDRYNQEPARSPAPYPRATSSVKGPVSPRRQLAHNDHNDPYQLTSYGSEEKNDWFGQEQQEAKGRSFQPKRMWSTLLRRNSSKETSQRS
ncbi:hypothetical protein JCM3765_004735 [Sporobolomyces pararoseus]